MPTVTGERMIPDAQVGELVHAEHLARYILAAELARGRRVLDAACGEGYGTAMLAAAGASSATGVDIDAEVIGHARSRYGRDFQVADVQELSFNDASFDLVVSFETIEHVSEPVRTLAEFRRVLAPGGLLVISTPNKLEYLVENEFHVREFTPDEFAAELGRDFAQVVLMRQQNFLTSAILTDAELADGDAERARDLRFYKAAGSEPGSELYTVALCGDEVPPAVSQVGVASEVYEAHRLADAYRALEQLKDQWVARATEAERLVGEWNARATKAEELLSDERTKLQQLESSTSWRLTSPLRALGRAAKRS